MKKLLQLVVAISATFAFVACNAAEPKPFKPNKPQDVQVYSAPNADGKITKESIEAAFKANGFSIIGNNNMNTPFEQRFGGGKDYKTYRLFFVYNAALVSKLVVKYPKIGLISPLSTALYSKDGSEMTIATLTLQGMSKITEIPEDNPDLIAIHKNMNDALAAALPGGKFQNVDYKIDAPQGPLQTLFTAEISGEDADELEEEKEGFQEELEGEIEPVGFIVAGFANLNDDLIANGVDAFDFYDVYSICKLEVIYPVHKKHPNAGAFAPCTLFMYKKKGEDTTYMGYPSVYNWISSLDIKDSESIDPLVEAQNLLAEKISEVAGE